MNPTILRKYETQRVPRYTSYPTAPHFQAMDETAYRDWLATVAPDARTSLYLHVPFCHSLCWYCGCHTKIPGHYDPIARYLDALRSEIDMVTDALPGRLRVAHLHWGGGTPTIAAPETLEALMAQLRRHFDFTGTAELAIEIDPRTLSCAMAATLGRIGINRASLGVQTFDPKVQKAINRVQSFEQTRATVDALRSNGISRINFDLLYGLPHQTAAMCEETVARAIELQPDRFAVFGYAHVPSMKPHQKRLDEAALPGAAHRLEQAKTIAAALTAAGYVRVGLDHFARRDDDLVARLDDGTLRRNFQGYTADRADILLGFGASSIGSLPQGYVQNTIPMKAYGEVIAAGRLPVARALPLTQEDRFRRELIERIMCFLEVDVTGVATRHGIDPRRLDPERRTLLGMAEDGIVELRGDLLRVNEAYRPLVRSVAAVFDAYLAPDSSRHAVAV